MAPTPTNRRPSSRLVAALAATTLVATALPLAALPSAAAAAGSAPRAPEISWAACGEGLEAFQCASVEVPSDYDRPQGATTTIALTRLPAGDPDARIGSLFVNFGGPGGPGVETLHLTAEMLVRPEVRERYDLVGFDPRAVGGSDPATCFRTAEDEAAFAADYPQFPTNPREESLFVAKSLQLGLSCAAFSAGRIATSSTANVARDLDLLRAAVGDEKLHYFGYSYGTYLGATYAALFPDRVGHMVLDGTVDPVAWAGVGSDALIGERIAQAPAATEVLGEFSRLCAEAGPDCSLNLLGEPADVLERVYAALRVHPVDLDLGDGTVMRVDYPTLVAVVFSNLYYAGGWQGLAELITVLGLESGLEPAGGAQQRLSAPTAPGELLRRLLGAEDYSSFGGALASVCVDMERPGQPWRYGAKVADLSKRYPHFGAMRGWVGLQCESVPVRDEDAYTGPWTLRAQAPVLVIGTRFDPATPYWQTRPYADLWPDARMLTVEGWGHTILGVSSCADAAVADYLLSGRATDGAVCPQDVAPFQGMTTFRTHPAVPSVPFLPLRPGA